MFAKMTEVAAAVADENATPDPDTVHSFADIDGTDSRLEVLKYTLHNNAATRRSSSRIAI